MAKIVETRKISDYEIMTDSGWQELEAAYKTIPYQVWKIKTKDFFLDCADEHIVFKKDLSEVYVKDLRKGGCAPTGSSRSREARCRWT